ncbi:hypothetical protein ACNKHS_07465 [Shigella flexneri]
MLQGKGDAAHEAAVAANVAMLMRLDGDENLKANAQTFWMYCAVVPLTTEKPLHWRHVG